MGDVSGWWHELWYPSNEFRQHTIILATLVVALVLRTAVRQRQDRGLASGATGQSVERVATFMIDLARGLLIGLAILIGVVLLIDLVTSIAS